MKQQRLGLQGLATVTMACALTACGGGGGGGDSGNGAGSGGGDPAQSSRITITSKNAPALTAESLDMANSGILTVDVGDDSLGSSGLGEASMQAIAALRGDSGREHAMGTHTSERTCADGGSLAMKVVLKTDRHLSAGDTLNFSYRNCSALGATIDGDLQIRLIKFSDDDLSSFTADTTVTGLTMKIGTRARRSDGKGRMSYERTSAEERLSLTSSSIKVQRLNGGKQAGSYTLTNYSDKRVFSKTTGNTTTRVNFDATGSFPKLGKTAFELRTLDAFVSPAGSIYPTSGRARITGSNGSSITGTAFDGGIKIDVDSNGDGKVDSSTRRTWTQLRAEL